MADRGQITGALLDGPLALDTAISPKAAAIKKIVSPVAGRANVLVVPDLEAGNMLAKSLSFLGGADAAGIVLGARVPIILTSRAEHTPHPSRFLRGRRHGRGGAPQGRGSDSLIRRLCMNTAQLRPVLEGQRALVIGMANEDSIAYGCAKAFRSVGADLAISWLNEKARRFSSRSPETSKPRSPARSTFPSRASWRPSSSRFTRDRGRLDILVHSIAFAPKADL